jgi:hypothetical protein
MAQWLQGLSVEWISGSGCFLVLLSLRKSGGKRVSDTLESFPVSLPYSR